MDAPERRLTTILCGDVVGYSRLMGEDERATLALLKTSREMIAAEIARHRGRIVNTAGDSVLAEFPSVVNAVECAVRIQRDLAERNATRPPDRRMQFRIGINLGDVLVEGDDLFGEGVNIAARLQALAEPGGVLVSGTVFEQVRNKLTLSFDFLGPQSVKNIAEAVPTWRVVLNGEARTGDQGARGDHAASDSARPAVGISVAETEPRRRWFGARGERRPRSAAQLAATAGVLIVALFTINMLTDSDSLWFQWPTLVIIVVFALRMISAWSR
jgi:adenylate cyclase